MSDMRIEYCGVTFGHNADGCCELRVSGELVPLPDEFGAWIIETLCELHERAVAAAEGSIRSTPGTARLPGRDRAEGVTDG
jgi:hypothetical protein